MCVGAALRRAAAGHGSGLGLRRACGSSDATGTRVLAASTPTTAATTG